MFFLKSLTVLLYKNVYVIFAQKTIMIIVTGAAGFIGSYFAGHLLKQGYRDIVLVDDFGRINKEPNHKDKDVTARVERHVFFDWLAENEKQVQFIVHLGARTDTTEFSTAIFDELNFGYSCRIWNACVQYGLPLIYASSAATYGEGENGYRDDESRISLLKPLNPYGESKNRFDLWALEQKEKPFFWAGFKFFNVYGPNEYHKGRMASVVFHSFNQINDTGKVRLFRSHRPGFADGEQIRDFIYVADVAKVLQHFMENRKHSGIYNLGTGKARSFNHLVQAVFSAMNKATEIEYIDIPEDIRDKYQYYTEADMNKMRQAGYSNRFTSLEEGISDYVSRYLMNQKIF
jgi:ADP-L-glycero-D-manno-heptose 6-epimerase